MIKAVLFDLDGTVLASKDGIFRSASYALEQLGYAMPSEEIMQAFLGPPLSMGFKTVCGVRDEHIEEAVRLYRLYYNGGGKFEAYIYDGIRDCIETLRMHGIATYITTSKPHVYAKEILAYFNADTLFDGIYGCEFDGTRGTKEEVVQYCMETHQLTADDAVLVGDRCFDAEGARACGIPCVGVTYGYGSREELQVAGTTHIVDTAQELCSWLLHA